MEGLRRQGCEEEGWASPVDGHQWQCYLPPTCRWLLAEKKEPRCLHQTRQSLQNCRLLPGFFVSPVIQSMSLLLKPLEDHTPILDPDQPRSPWPQLFCPCHRCQHASQSHRWWIPGWTNDDTQSKNAKWKINLTNITVNTSKHLSKSKYVLTFHVHTHAHCPLVLSPWHAKVPESESMSLVQWLASGLLVELVQSAATAEALHHQPGLAWVLLSRPRQPLPGWGTTFDIHPSRSRVQGMVNHSGS